MTLKEKINKKTFILLVFDVIVINLAYFLALFLRFEASFETIPQVYLNSFSYYAPINTILTIGIYSFFKLYRMILQYASYNELIRISQATVVSLLVHIIGINLLFIRMPVSYFIFGFLIQYTGTVALRFAKKMFMQGKYNAIEKNPHFKRAIIIGAGSAGQTIKEDINKSNTEENTRIKVLAFIDDDPEKKGQYIDGTLIYGGKRRNKRLGKKRRYRPNTCSPSLSPRRPKKGHIKDMQ